MKGSYGVLVLSAIVCVGFLFVVEVSVSVEVWSSVDLEPVGLWGWWRVL